MNSRKYNLRNRKVNLALQAALALVTANASTRAEGAQSPRISQP